MGLPEPSRPAVVCQVLDAEQRVAMHERRGMRRHPVDRATVGVEQQRPGTRLRRAALGCLDEDIPRGGTERFCHVVGLGAEALPRKRAAGRGADRVAGVQADSRAAGQQQLHVQV